MSNLITFSFFRDYKRYTGGHQKFRDYLTHTMAFKNTRCSLFVQGNCQVMPHFFNGIEGVTYQTKYAPESSDIVFLAGMDWSYYLPIKTKDQPIINLVQHVRHGDKQSPLFEFLKHNALRICVSEAVKNAIEPHANGECITIPMGHDIPFINEDKKYDLYILSKKNKSFGRELYDWGLQQGLTVKLHEELQSRDQVMLAMAAAKVSIPLPNPTEGFFLPGIEAMALSDRVVVPDAIGNREYIKRFTNVLMCDYSLESCINAIEKSFVRLRSDIHPFEKFNGERLARNYTMGNERAAFHETLKKFMLK